MDFKDQIKQLGDRVTKLKDQIQTEEATKNAFIMPFLQTLGYPTGLSVSLRPYVIPFTPIHVSTPDSIITSYCAG